MNFNESIEIVKSAFDNWEYPVKPEDEAKEAESLTIAIEAMKKQEPMKVKTTFGGWLNCPACDMDISDYDTHDFTPGYCPNCGQAINWEEATK